MQLKPAVILIANLVREYFLNNALSELRLFSARAYIYPNTLNYYSRVAGTKITTESASPRIYLSLYFINFSRGPNCHSNLSSENHRFEYRKTLSQPDISPTKVGSNNEEHFQHYDIIVL